MGGFGGGWPGNIGGNVSSIGDWLKKEVGKGVTGLSNAGDPSQDDAETATFRGLGNAGREAFKSGMFARGGIVRQPTVALLGEQNRPELVAPLTNKKRMGELAAQLKSMQRTPRKSRYGRPARY